LHAARPGFVWPEIGVALNLGLLGLLKFGDFLGANGAWLLGLQFRPLEWILPLGISFFVFQKVSYLIDLRRGSAHAYGLLDFFMFVTFFPQLIAGPIVRHNEIIGQFDLPPRRPEMWENLSRGALLFLAGLAKKAGIADTIAENTDRLFAAAATAPPGLLDGWAAAGCFTLQIYFDFSGYSDMAIGLALMFGLTLPANFAAPYRATSIREFWRRWHMTLSRFLRDYLYIPLGGGRGGAWRQARNVIVTMLLGGLWHGAAWSFVAWGGLHGAALAIDGAWARAGLRLPAPLGWALTMVFVMAGWVLFRAADFGTAAGILAGMAGMQGPGAVRLDNAWVAILGTLIVLAAPTSQALLLHRLRPAPWLALPAALAAVALLLLVGARPAQEFIYFQF
jgi:D-alanyl-lipoteichoic acid acyltransferase DltB (MBOAT superfamily)